MQKPSGKKHISKLDLILHKYQKSKKKKKDSPLKISKSCTRLIKAKDTYCVTLFKNTFMAELLLQFNTAPCKFRELFLTFKIDAAETAISPPC